MNTHDKLRRNDCLRCVLHTEVTPTRQSAYIIPPRISAMKLTAVIAIALAMGRAPLFAQPVSGGGFEVRTLSTRPDLVSGGDVLIRILPPGSRLNDIVVTVNGRAANADSKPTMDGTAVLARLKDLNTGKNEIAVGFQGQRPAVRLRVVNH